MKQYNENTDLFEDKPTNTNEEKKQSLMRELDKNKVPYFIENNKIIIEEKEFQIANDLKIALRSK